MYAQFSLTNEVYQILKIVHCVVFVLLVILDFDHESQYCIVTRSFLDVDHFVDMVFTSSLISYLDLYTLIE